MDMLTPGEAAVDEHTPALRFDIALLADRLVHATDAHAQNPDIRMLHRLLRRGPLAAAQR